jgi:ATP adenylyltransferase
LAFYNSNAVAGASQPWRHIQFIETPGPAPVEEWCRGIDFGGHKDKAIVHPNLPYTHVIHPLPFDELRDVEDFESEETQERIVDVLAPAIMRCLDLAIDTVRRVENVGQTGWNLLMTL